MQNAAFRALGLPAVYVALRCSASDLPGLLRALCRAGGGGNVTVPYKEAAALAADRCSPLGGRLGAVNTFWAEPGGDGKDIGAVVGDNTDVIGLLDALLPLQVPTGPWLIAGTGGGARAAVAAAGERGASVAIASRDGDRARIMERWAAGLGVAIAPSTECRVAVNTTPLGLGARDPLPVARADIPSAEVAFDLVYARGETRWVRAMRAEGLRAADGRAMLVGQGAAALERWFPSAKAPVEVMRAVVNAELR